MERRKRRQASLDSREANLSKREDDIRRLEERLGTLESALQRKEADLTAFAEMLQQSLSRAEAAAGDQARVRRPADDDPTQRLRFWTRDSAAGGSKGNNAA